MAAEIELKKHVPSGTIVLNRPEKCNALTRRMVCDLKQALDDFHLERSVRAVIMTGSGEAFCAGADLSEIHESFAAQDAQQQWHRDAVLYKELLEAMLRFPKPIIAAVNGPAVGSGAALVLASDLVVAGPAATFGLPEPLRGLVAGLVVPLLTFRVGAGLAARLTLTGELVSAERALQMNIYHEVVKGDQVWARAFEMARQCATAAPESLQLTKRLLNETVGEWLGSQLAVGAAAAATSHTTEAAAEGVQAFLEKREPKWP